MQGKTSEAAPTIGVVSGRRKDGAPHPTCQRGEEEGAIFQLPTVFPSAFKAVGGRMNRQSMASSLPLNLCCPWFKSRTDSTP